MSSWTDRISSFMMQMPYIGNCFRFYHWWDGLHPLFVICSCLTVIDRFSSRACKDIGGCDVCACERWKMSAVDLAYHRVAWSSLIRLQHVVASDRHVCAAPVLPIASSYILFWTRVSHLHSNTSAVCFDTTHLAWWLIPSLSWYALSFSVHPLMYR